MKYARVVGVVTVVFILYIMDSFVRAGGKVLDQFAASKCFDCEAATAEMGYPTQCFDCERGRSSAIEYQLGFPSGNAKVFAGLR